ADMRCSLEAWYGPTVVITTRVDSATDFSVSGWDTSAVSSSRSAHDGLIAARRSRTASSFARFRPASAQRACAGTLRARYSAVRPPVNPVAPNSTMSNRRSAMGPTVDAFAYRRYVVSRRRVGPGCPAPEACIVGCRIALCHACPGRRQLRQLRLQPRAVPGRSEEHTPE